MKSENISLRMDRKDELSGYLFGLNETDQNLRIKEKVTGRVKGFITTWMSERIVSRKVEKVRSTSSVLEPQLN